MRLSPPDNVAVALRTLKAGETVALDGDAIVIRKQIPVGHKLAARTIAKGERVIKYSCQIGTAKTEIVAGEALNAQNVEASYGPTTEVQK